MQNKIYYWCFTKSYMERC